MANISNMSNELTPIQKKYIKFDCRPFINVLYFHNTDDGIRSMDIFWHKNWLYGVTPKITLVNSINKKYAK